MYLLAGAMLLLLLGGSLAAVAVPRSVKCRGFVVDGRGLGSVLVAELDLQPVLGYEPYRGTVNIRLDRRTTLCRPIATVFAGQRTYDIWPVTVEGRDCHAIAGRHWRKDPNVVEVLAPVRLRDSGEVFEIDLRHRVLPTWTQVRRRVGPWVRNTVRSATVLLMSPLSRAAKRIRTAKRIGLRATAREVGNRVVWRLRKVFKDSTRTAVDRKRWSADAQAGELAFHKRPNSRSDRSWEENNEKLWRRLGFEPDGWEGKLIVDVGAGSRLRTLFFRGARIAAIEPLAKEFMTEVEWQDLEKAEEIYPVPAEDEIPELVGRADLVVSINTLDHGFDFERTVRNIRRYLKDDGRAFLSFDQHAVPDRMHPLVLNEAIARDIFERSGLTITSFDEARRYHGGTGPKALNYWLEPRP